MRRMETTIPGFTVPVSEAEKRVCYQCDNHRYVTFGSEFVNVDGHRRWFCEDCFTLDSQALGD